MNRTPLLVAGGAILAAALLAGGWWLGRHEGESARAQAGAPASETPKETTAATTAPDPAANDNGRAIAERPALASTPAAVAPVPLPPADAPVAEIFDDLLERARRGDTRAACRLGADLQRCQGAERGFRAERFERRVAGESDPERREEMIQRLAAMEVRREGMLARCVGVTAEQTANAFALQMQAAQADPSLRPWVALNPALDPQTFVADLDHWQQYRQVAQNWLEAAAAEGDLGAVLALTRVYGDMRGRRGPMSPPLRLRDDARFVTYASLAERYGISIPPVQRAADAARQRIEPAQLAAEAQARALHRADVAPPAGDSEFNALWMQSVNRIPEPADCDGG
jgi:hypothetical protein